MKIGFIGTGNMGSAMMGGIISSGIVEASDVMASDIFQAALDRVSDEFNVNTSLNNRDVVEFADIVFLAVKPQYLPDAINGIKETGVVLPKIKPPRRDIPGRLCYLHNK